MSKRIEALNEVKQYVEERKHIRYDYIQVKEDGYVSYDAIGYIAHELGMSDEFLKSLNGDEIGSDEITTHTFVNELIAFGFSIEELVELQEKNDYSDSAEDLIAYIDVLIEAS